jgi:alkylation response protein AidB-like acyl-CoA dehydrogenase
MLNFLTEADATRTNETRATVRDLVDQWASEGRFEPAADNWMRGFDPEFSKELAQRGLIGTTWPRPYGHGNSHAVRLAATEELLRTGAPVAAHWIADRQIGPSVLRHGSPELQADLLPLIANAESVCCLGMSEPEAGSDLASVRTKATRDGDNFVLRGRKVWTTGAHHATHMYVLARTSEEERKHQGLTEFIIDMNTPGVDVSPIPDIAGEHHFNEVTFDDVVVPANRVLGEVGNGWKQVVEQLSFERGGPERVLSSYPLMAELLAARGASGGDFDVEIGSMSARLLVLRRLCYRMAMSLDAGAAPVRDAATLKMLGNQYEQDLVDLARRVHGETPTLDSAIGRALCALPGFTIRGGAVEVMLNLIARQEAAS